MSPAHAMATFWERSKITIVFVAVALSFIFAYHLNDDQNQARIDSVCGALAQVKGAAEHLAKPASAAGVTDPNTLARIHASNVERAAARVQLNRDLSCREQSAKP